METWDHGCMAEITLTKADIRKWSRAVRDKGRHLLDARHLRQVDYAMWVCRSATNPNRVYVVSVEALTPEYLTVSCSCPAYTRCSHMLAALTWFSEQWWEEHE